MDRVLLRPSPDLFLRTGSRTLGSSQSVKAGPPEEVPVPTTFKRRSRRSKGKSLSRGSGSAVYGVRQWDSSQGASRVPSFLQSEEPEGPRRVRDLPYAVQDPKGEHTDPGERFLQTLNLRLPTPVLLLLSVCPPTTGAHSQSDSSRDRFSSEFYVCAEGRGSGSVFVRGSPDPGRPPNYLPGTKTSVAAEGERHLKEEEGEVKRLRHLWCLRPLSLDPVRDAVRPPCEWSLDVPFRPLPLPRPLSVLLSSFDPNYEGLGRPRPGQ